MGLKHSFAAMLSLAILLSVLVGGLCQEITGRYSPLPMAGSGPAAPAPLIAPVTQEPVPAAGPRIILQRLDVTYWGQDGGTVIGSGCPGVDGKGTLIDYHFTVDGSIPPGL